MNENEEGWPSRRKMRGAKVKGYRLDQKVKGYRNFKEGMVNGIKYGREQINEE